MVLLEEWMMTWRDLKVLVNTMNEECLDKPVNVFPYNNGEMYQANLVVTPGTTIFDYHCDMTNIDGPYIICGYEE